MIALTYYSRTEFTPELKQLEKLFHPFLLFSESLPTSDKLGTCSKVLEYGTYCRELRNWWTGDHSFKNFREPGNNSHCMICCDFSEKRFVVGTCIVHVVKRVHQQKVQCFQTYFPTFHSYVSLKLWKPPLNRENTLYILFCSLYSSAFCSSEAFYWTCNETQIDHVVSKIDCDATQRLRLFLKHST